MKLSSLEHDLLSSILAKKKPSGLDDTEELVVKLFDMVSLQDPE